jgi:hypothetical protein
MHDEQTGARRPYRRVPRHTTAVDAREPDSHFQVRGIAQLNGFLFVIGASPTSEIRVFDASPPHRQLADITVPGLSSPRDVVGCPESGRLYVADWNVADYHSGHCIWRVDVGPPASAAAGQT